MVSNLFGSLSATNDTVSWHPEATTRGTYTLPSSCLITTALCVHTAVHLNIAGYNERKILWINTQTWRKLGWLVLGLLAPEMYLGTPNFPSWYKRVWRKPRFLFRKDIEDAAEREKSPKPLWTMRHGFFAVMGGLMFDTTEAPQLFMPKGYERLTLDLDAICFLLKHEPDLLPYITAKDIDNKSQAGGLGKLLVCLQALWFCVQCISRLKDSLPISLLELNTFGHSVCTILIYLMWWEKPMDVMEPTIISGPKAWFYCAALFMSNTSSGLYGVSEADLVYNLYNDNFPTQSTKPKDRQDGFASIKVSEGRVPLAEVLMTLVESGVTSLSFDVTRRQIMHIPSSDPGFAITPIHRVRWKIVSEGLTAVAGTDRALHRAWEENIASVVVAPRIRNLPPITKLKQNVVRADPDFNIEGYRRGWFLVQLGFVSAGIIYGGLHALAWNAPFSSPAQQLVWRISSVLIMAIGVGAVVVVVLRQALMGISTGVASLFEGLPGGDCANVLGSMFSYLVYFSSLLLIALFLLAYVFARAYLVVECFINISHLPVGVYTVAQGANYIFHFS
ncbi:uncharacterized protein LY89DRAFT_719043 [Mollisia scopiformis]|uniref:Uncharacterized protein n=1 Tax=Mollisia scopiformis TaxID=149040 RepID=A0A194X800_MOLSC|nr:uncharacterized protein LY89DRAFT_719043 [Mollisia scopiformis]KUJ16290.1 hypothetical protein LY89DRAFT_719043 [Mollisia scopiformis]